LGWGAGFDTKGLRLSLRRREAQRPRQRKGSNYNVKGSRTSENGLPPAEHPRLTARRMETAANDFHIGRRLPRPLPETPLNWRFQLRLCDCGRLVGGSQRLGSGQHLQRCESCYSWPRHPVEMALTEASALLFALTINR
jgi:hypothetical protein